MAEMGELGRRRGEGSGEIGHPNTVTEAGRGPLGSGSLDCPPSAIELPERFNGKKEPNQICI